MKDSKLYTELLNRKKLTFRPRELTLLETANEPSTTLIKFKYTSILCCSPNPVSACLSSFLSMKPELSLSQVLKMFCQSVMYFHTPANSLKFTPLLFSLSNMAEKGGGGRRHYSPSHTLTHRCTHNSNMLSSSTQMEQILSNESKKMAPHIVLKSCQRPENVTLWVSHLTNLL